jgi:hypothetical protein
VGAVIEGFGKILVDCRLEAQILLGVTEGLNDQRPDTVLLF